MRFDPGWLARLVFHFRGSTAREGNAVRGKAVDLRGVGAHRAAQQVDERNGLELRERGFAVAGEPEGGVYFRIGERRDRTRAFGHETSPRQPALEGVFSGKVANAFCERGLEEG